MSTDYNCSRQYCEHDLANMEKDRAQDWANCEEWEPCQQCEKCNWERTLPYHWGLVPMFETCPECKIGHVMVYGKRHVSPLHAIRAEERRKTLMEVAELIKAVIRDFRKELENPPPQGASFLELKRDGFEREAKQTGCDVLDAFVTVIETEMMEKKP